MDGNASSRRASLALVCLLWRLSKSQNAFSYQCSGCDWPGACQESELQSPINILEYQSTCDVSHTFKYQAIADSVDVSILQDPSGVIAYAYFLDFFLRDLDDSFVGFNSTAIKFRMPSEHQLNGKIFDLEMQITGHRKPEYTSKLSSATISVLFNQVPEQERVFSSDPVYTTTKIFDDLDISKLGNRSSTFPAQFISEMAASAYYFYQGTLTEPSCDPHQWVVFMSFLFISKDKLDKIRTALFNSPSLRGMSSNSRKLQIKGDRLVVKGGLDCSTYFGYIVAFVFLFIFMVYIIFRLL